MPAAGTVERVSSGARENGGVAEMRSGNGGDLKLQGAFRLWPVKGLTIAGALLALLTWAAPARAAEGCPTSGLGSGYLPDCRVYEQVSPLDKNAFEAGSLGAENPGISYSSPDGSRTFYGTSGAMGETEAGVQPYTMSVRGPDGWHARNAFPRPQDPDGIAYGHVVRSLLPSEDLSSFFFWSGTRWLPQVPAGGNGDGISAYLLREGQPLEWVTAPRDEDAHTPDEFKYDAASYRIRPAGGASDLSRFYFNYLGTLLPGDEPRVPNAEEKQALGIYEYEEGQLRNAGTLPDGTLDPMGAVAAGSVAPFVNFVDDSSPEVHNNQVSADGRTLWFVSPDPTPDRGRVTQLYARVDGASELASRSELTDQPAATGVRPVPHVNEWAPSTDSYAFGAEDGSRAFFQSTDRLTADAPEDAAQKTYMYEVAGDDLVYLPELNGGYILEGSRDGSRLLLLNADRTRLELWEEGSGLTLVGEIEPTGFFGAYSSATRATADGSVFTFTLSDQLAGLPNPSGLPQAYRYEVASGDLDCLSCPPGGAPTSEAVLSRTRSAGSGSADANLVGMRAMSADGKWVFFDTADALVPADTNGKPDAYRWSEADGPRLLSTGHSSGGSFMLDISTDGSSAFFTTKEGISPQDVDGSYDVYVARVGGGFTSTELPPCQGEECQGPVTATPSLLEPGSKSLRGRGKVGSEPRRLVARLRGRDGKLRLRVSVPTAGRILVSGPNVQPLRRGVAKPGSYVLSPRLKPAARKTLALQGQLKVRVEVRFLPRDGQATVRTITTEVSR
jgi:hypothetical protein